MLVRYFPGLWVAVFFVLVFKGSVLFPPGAELLVLGLAGVVYCLGLARKQWREMLGEHAGLLAASFGLALAILWSQSAAAWRGVPLSHMVPFQASLVLCLPVLALFLTDVRILQAVVALFCALILWHFVMLPVEAVTGFKLTWQPRFPQPRDMGLLKFQASGLTIANWCFIGLYLPLFYLAWGPVAARRVFGGRQLPDWLMGVLPLLWVIPVATVQSRSGLAGALCAGILALLTWHKRLKLGGWLALVAGTLLAAWLYWLLFAEGKTGPGLRVAYAKAYLQEALQWEWLATGRGFSLHVVPTIALPGLTPLVHSHNDFTQVFYSWGLPGLLAYLAFWFALIRLVFTRFVSRAEYWPAFALITLIPNMVTDLGLHFFEKAAFLVILAAMCMACAGRRQPAQAAVTAFPGA